MLSPPSEAFGGDQKPNCTFTGRTTGVVMVPIVIEPLSTCPVTHATTSKAVSLDSSMMGLSSGQLVNGV